MNCLRLLILILVLSLNTHAATFFVKPTSTGTGSGNSVANAIAYTSVAAASAAGDTWRLCGSFGDFGSIHVTKDDTTVLSCGATGLTNKWSAEIVGSAGTHAVYTDDDIHGMTVWGLRIKSAYIDGIKNNGNRATNIDCWIANAGRGDAGWTTNGSYRGQGIAFHTSENMHIERNLIENCGAYPTQDHAMYGSGTNILIRGNITRSNMAWGLQIYEASPSDNHNVVIEDNLIHDNGHSLYSNSGITLWTYGAGKYNRIVNNTIVARGNKYGIILEQTSSSSKVGLTNNIIQASAAYGIVAVSGAAGTNAVWADYNLFSTIQAGEPHGANDVQGSATFDSEANGRYWIASGSAGRNMALSSAAPSIDFFGRSQSAVADVGFTQYEVPLASDDTRDLRDGARDPWVREAANLAVGLGASGMVLTWTEPNHQHAFYYIQRKDSIGESYEVLTSVANHVLTYTDPYSGMTNGLTYTYITTPETSLGNSGGIHNSPGVGQVYTAGGQSIRFVKAFRF